MKVFGRPIRLGDAPLADVVIFDAVNSAYVRRAISPSHRPAVLQARPFEIRLGVRVLWWFVRRLPALRHAQIERARGLARGLARELWLSYVEAMILAMRPRAVVTFIDNSGTFHWLSRRPGSLPYIAIQNGTRLRCHAAPDSGYFLQHLFSHGTHEARTFPAFGYKVRHFHPTGSLIAGLHWPEETVPETLDLLIVSTWRGNIGWTREAQDTMRGMRVMDERLAEFLRRRGLRAAVIARAERGSEHWFIPELGQSEEDYYRGIYGDAARFIETDFVNRNVFPLMAASRVVVSCLSSAGLEALGFGRKVLYCNFTGTTEYHADLSPEILEDDPERLADRLDALLSEPQEAYDARMREQRRYYMSNPADRRPHVAIAEGIDRIIASAG